MSLKFSDDATFTKNFPKQPPCLSQLLEMLFLLDCKDLKFKKNKATVKVFCSHSIRSKLSILLTFLPCPETNTFNRLSGSIYAGALKECIWWNFFPPKFKAFFHINEMPRIIKHFKKRIIFYHKFQFRTMYISLMNVWKDISTKNSIFQSTTTNAFQWISLELGTLGSVSPLTGLCYMTTVTYVIDSELTTVQWLSWCCHDAPSDF